MYRRVFILIVAVTLVFGDFGLFTVERALAVTCANDGSITFFDNGSEQCIGVITSTGSGTFIPPSDWSNINQLDLLGGGGNAGNRVGAGGGTGGGGGGAGGFVRIVNTSSLSPEVSVTYNVAAANTLTSASPLAGTWICTTTTGCTDLNDTNVFIGIQSGTAGSGATAGTGASTAHGAPTVQTNGGGGRNGNTSTGGGGGAGGPSGHGETATSATGGTGDNGNTAATANGTQWTVNGTSYGSGGGGTGVASGSGGVGGNYGAGGGGAGTASGNTGGAGKQGVIVITYTPASEPSVTTGSASSITVTTATLNGTVTSDNNASSTARGFAYSTDPTLATGVSTTSENGTFDIGAFSANINSLTSNTPYYFRAFASNTAGTGFGSIEPFTTAAGDTAPPRTLKLKGNIKLLGNIKLR